MKDDWALCGDLIVGLPDHWSQTLNDVGGQRFYDRRWGIAAWSSLWRSRSTQRLDRVSRSAVAFNKHGMMVTGHHMTIENICTFTS